MDTTFKPSEVAIKLHQFTMPGYDFESIALRKFRKIAGMYDCNEEEARLWVYNEMLYSGINFDEVKQKAYKVDPLVGDSILHQLSLLPEYQGHFFLVTERLILN